MCFVNIVMTVLTCFSPDLSRLRGDADQWQAAQKVAASPVCIMSGKGGCGKTTVVTQLIQHVCQR